MPQAPNDLSHSGTIFTLDARGHVLLQIARNEFDITSPALHAAIQGLHQQTIQVLAAKGIDYNKLKSALVPRSDRNEAAFIFDSTAVASPCYGYEILRHMLPLLEPRSTQSVVLGDLVDENQFGILQILRESMVLARSFTFRHGTALYCVYLNNLTDAMLENLNEKLASFSAYLGYIPTSFESRAKIYLSGILMNAFLKHRDRIIMGHEDDRSNEDNVNMSGGPFEEFGYRVFSLRSIQYGIFLTFKIERPLYKGFEIDSEMALNALSVDVHPLDDLTVELPEAKHKYLLSEKGGKLRKAQLEDFDRHQLALLIKSKFAANYIYNMEYLPQYDVMKFNIMLEVKRKDGGYPTRLTAALRYIPQEKLLRVVTLC